MRVSEALAVESADARRFVQRLNERLATNWEQPHREKRRAKYDAVTRF